MARRAKADRDAAAAEKTLATAPEQVLDRVAEQIADKIAQKLAGKIAEAVAASLTAATVDSIAASVVGRLAAGTQPAQASMPAPAPAAASASGRPSSKPEEAVIWVAAQSSDMEPHHDGVEAASDAQPLSVAVAEMVPAPATPEPRFKLDAEPVTEAPAVEPPAEASSSEASAFAAGGKRRSPEADQAPPQKRARMAYVPPRRNPRRVASDAAERALPPSPPSSPPGELLTAALQALSDADIAAWQGWAELESEPAFFNYIVKKLGVKGVTIKELLSLDSWALALLPRPVFGLIFLFQYSPQMGEDDTDSFKDAPVWFANQTTVNSCGSVALLNIMMNAEQLDLGEQLQAFKEATKDLTSPLRGRRIGANGFVRAAHNSFVRRLDILEADLNLANEVDAAKLKRSHKIGGGRKGRRQASATSSGKGARGQSADSQSFEFGFHFIAYVPADGFVWELDGMRSHPDRVGPLISEDWTADASPRIKQRIQDCGNGANNFSLLAMCRSPLDTQRAAIASHIHGIRRLCERFQGDHAFTQLATKHDKFDDDVTLGEFQLVRTTIAAAEAPQFIKERLSLPNLTVGQAHGLYNQLISGINFAMAKYRDEVIAVSDEDKRVEERKKDYSPVLHCWMKKLANKGVLGDVIRTSS